MLRKIKYYHHILFYQGKALNRNRVGSLFLIILLASFVSLAFDGLTSVRAQTTASVNGITVLNVASQQSFVEQGFTATLTATVENTGSSTSTFEVAFCGNGIPLDTQPVTLAGETTSSVSFAWNTTGLALGNYTLSAFVWSSSGETSAVSPACVSNAPLLVTCLGDLTGQFAVNFNDVVTFVAAYINYYQTGYCNPAADFSHDGKLNFNDVVLFVGYYEAYFEGPTPFVTSHGLTLTMSIDQTTFSAGEPVDFTLSINNVSKNPITLEYSASTFDYFVFNATGIVYRYSFGMVYPMWVQLYTLAPGASLTQDFEWDQTCNLFVSPLSSCISPLVSPSDLAGSPAVFPAAPGTYDIVGEAFGMQTLPQQITITSQSPTPTIQ